ncbi:Hypothetical predicted protein [Paramuricea clavata]|uniref:Uncharacterized protein n=2 Tax=Paramuricea clavata TaxID=317549 RepID=A0A6S7J121_PARCT|nr:Hypothetical predicted protein [Paramuricea clavata]
MSEHGAIVQNTEVSTEESQPEEVDWLATPVRPTTYTKLFHPSPLLKSQNENSGFSTPESLELPRQPTTRTPMIKGTLNFDSPPDDDTNPKNSLVDDLPTPPTFATPGLKLYGKKADKTNADDVETSMHYDPLNTPPRPNVTFVRRLNPEDLCSNSAKSASPAKVELPAQLEQPNNRTYEFPDVSYEIYQTLPDSVQRQFPFQQINLLIGQTNIYLNTRTKVNSAIVTDEELMSVLQLGPFTRAFALAMLKLEYFTVKRSGVYSVHDKMIV